MNCILYCLIILVSTKGESIIPNYFFYKSTLVDSFDIRANASP